MTWEVSATLIYGRQWPPLKTTMKPRVGEEPPSYALLSAFLGLERFQIFNFFRLWNICTYIIRYLRDGTKVQPWNSFMFYIHTIHSSYIHSLKVIVSDIFSAPVI